MSNPLNLVSIPVDGRHLYEFARGAGLAVRDFDEGYATHALLSALFDGGSSVVERVAPKPFALADTTQRVFQVLGYSPFDRDALTQRAQTYGDPRAFRSVDLEGIASKPLPVEFATGLRLGFSARLCPVRRVKKRGNQRQDRAELDVFLAKSFELDDASVLLDREQVYREWLGQELTKGGASLVRGSMTSFRLGRMHRRTQAPVREGRRVSHPDATFQGILEVVDGSQFRGLLARGVGRHRAFGFGMLLLRPPGRE